MTATPVAVIGVACRLPGANDPETFWKRLAAGDDLVTEVPPDRWDVDAYFQPGAAAPGKSFTRWGGFLDRVDGFDPRFFRITEREAVFMDPQQRLLLETAWDALADAGRPGDGLAGSRTGVFTGISSYDYGTLIMEDLRLMSGFSGVGSALSISANRLSYCFDLRGPSLAVDTACSSSLVALHLACGSLARGESEMALAGGVNVILRPNMMVGFSQAAMMARDGRCKTFDARADGFVRAEGCVVVVLKTLEAALRDGDRIHAIVRGSAVNQDGLTNGIAAPSGRAQAAVIREALASAGVLPREVSYVEAHGTGTSIGDAIEVGALRATYLQDRPGTEGLIAGSTKTNMGHAEAASGLVGVLKLILSFRHGLLPRHLHFQTPNPHLGLQDGRIRVPAQGLPWTRGNAPRLAGVSAFGFGGTNAHAILEEPAVPRPAALPAREVHVVALRAKTDGELRAQAALAASALGSGVALGDLAHSLSTSAPRFAHRAAVAARDEAGLRAALDALASGSSAPGLATGSGHDTPRVAWIFSGQGAQAHGMGRALYETEPVYRAAFDRVAAVIDARRSTRLADAVFGGDLSRIDETEWTQPALLATEWALAELWRSWGLVPDFVLGHSIGEFAAAAVAGALTIEDAALLVERRASLMQSIERRGAMLSVALPEPEVASLIAPWSGQVSIAAVNALESVVVSGDEAAIADIAEVCRGRNVVSKRLAVSHAFHSPLMSPILEAFEAEAGRVAFAAPRVPLVSNLTGALLPAGGYTGTYWRNHLREPVRFADGVRTLLSSGVNVFLETGPGSILTGLVRQSAGPSVTCVTSTRRGGDDLLSIAQAAAELDAKGVAIDWRARDASRQVRRTAIPGYPFRRKRFWLPDLGSDVPAPEAHPLLGEPIELARGNPGETTFRSSISTEGLPLLSEHRVFDRPVFPGAAWLEMALGAARRGDPRRAVADVTFERPLLVEGAIELQLSTRGEAFEIHGAPATATPRTWTRHVSGRFAPAGPDAAPIDGAAISARCPRAIDVDAAYEALSAGGLGYGPRFRPIRSAQAGEGECLAELALPEELRPEASTYLLHPGLLDGAFQALALAAGDSGDVVLLPSGLERFEMTGPPPPGPFLVHARIERRGPGDATGSITLAARDGVPFARVTGFVARAVDRDAFSTAISDTGGSTFALAWRPRGLPADPATVATPAGRVLCTEEDVLVVLASRGHDAVAIKDYGEALAALRGLAEPALLVTRGARMVTGHETRPASLTERSSLWGLARVVNTERHATLVRMLDLDPARGDLETEVDDILRELASGSNEEGVALRSRRRYVERVVPLDPRERLLEAPAGRPYRLSFRTRGSIDRLELRGLHRRAPGEGEVEIRVNAAGLNFRDVMNVLGTYPGDPGEIGIECAGVIETVGAGVAGLRRGDRVAAMYPGVFGSFATAPAALVARVPEGLSFEDAAALPVVYLTAHLALESPSRVQKGTRVLVHAAAGGVGLAALQIALRAGAEVFATAGSEEKRSLLRSMGVAHVASSRTLAFATAFREASSGGVDVVLNSLPGEFIPRSLELLAPRGTYVEIGKTGTWSADAVRALRSDVRYEVLALDELVARDPARIGRTLEAVLGRFGRGELRPGPKLVFPMERARAAFRHMSAGRHVGKVVLSLPAFEPGAGVRVRRDGSYVVTGGRGGLGLEVARWLAGQGAGHIVLVSRGVLDEAGERAVGEARASGARVSIVRADVADREGLERALVPVLRGAPPWRGLVHAAGVLDDGPLETQTREGFECVSAPKNAGLVNLESIERTLGASLDFCVVTSSLAALAGNAGQAPYAAANLWLAEQMHDRHARGLAGTSIHFGPWDGVGMTARLTPAIRKQFAAAGVGVLPPQQGTTLLGSLLASDRPEAGAFRIDFARAQALRSRSLFEELSRAAPGAATHAPARLADLIRERPESEHLALVRHFVARELGAITGASLETLASPALAFSDLGLDSLMAIELRHRLQQAVEPRVQLAANVLFSHPTIDALAALLLEGVRSGAAPEALPSSPPAASDRTTLRLFAIPYAGGGALAYARWHGLLPDWIHFDPLQLPGREERANEAALRSVPELTRHLADAITARADRPFAIFGHSLGAILAVATARELRRRGGPLPVHLALSGLGPSPDALRKAFGARPSEDPSALIRKLESLGLVLPLPQLDDTTHSYMTQVLAADLDAFVGHHWEEEAALGIDASVWGGTEDRGATVADLSAWSGFARLTAAPELLEGGHFYWRENPQALVSRLVERLSAPAATR